MNILVISSNYPTNAFPNYGAFVYNLMQELGKRHQITVISPYKVHHLFKKNQKTYGEEKCKVLRPVYLSISDKKIAGINTRKISAYLYRKAVQGVVNKLPVKPDIIYVHFLSNAIPVLNYAKENNIPLVIASGESTYNSWRKTSVEVQAALKHQVNHIICVSKENKKQLKELGFDENKMSVIPNAVNYSLFKPLNKNKCKEKLGISKDKFIVGFIGHFIYRKGPSRIIESIELLNDKEIQLVCVGGKGQLKPNSFTKEIEPVPNYQLPEILNAFDLFVLPTLKEGHCNVIEEAKACGIPVISSKGTSVEDQIDTSIGILIDPLDIQDIARAISVLKKDDNLRHGMVQNLIDKRGENSIQERANKISEVLSSIF